jgi:hypothetical protein
MVFVLFTISRSLNLKLATDPISIENSLSAEIRQVTDFRGLKSDRWPISVMEIGSLRALKGNAPVGQMPDDQMNVNQKTSYQRHSA